MEPNGGQDFNGNDIPEWTESLLFEGIRRVARRAMTDPFFRERAVQPHEMGEDDQGNPVAIQGAEWAVQAVKDFGPFKNFPPILCDLGGEALEPYFIFVETDAAPTPTNVPIVVLPHPALDLSAQDEPDPKCDCTPFTHGVATFYFFRRNVQAFMWSKPWGI